MSIVDELSTPLDDEFSLYYQSKANEQFRKDVEVRTSQRQRKEKDIISERMVSATTHSITSPSLEPLIELDKPLVEDQKRLTVPKNVPLFEMVITPNLYTKAKLANLRPAELRSIAQNYGISIQRKSNEIIIDEILRKQAEPKF